MNNLCHFPLHIARYLYTRLVHGFVHRPIHKPIHKPLETRCRNDYVIGFQELNSYTGCEKRIIGVPLIEGPRR